MDRDLASLSNMPGVTCRLPGRDPVDLATGLNWLEEMVRYGHNVSHFVTSEHGKRWITCGRR